MAFFWNQPQFASSELGPLFRFLDEVADNSATHCKPKASSRQSSEPHFRPKFDIVETDTAYELFGDLPGVAQQDLAVEFPDVQTLTVQGKVERRHPTKATATEETSAPKETVEDDASSTKGKQASVAEGNDNDDDEYMQVDKQGEQATESKPAASKPSSAEDAAPNFKFHALERKLGRFSRTFSFPAPVDTENVTASLKDGVLSVRVPKTTKANVKKVSIQ